ncbi:MAG: ABC transporter ATP-binding protein [Gammaproteobacteria bacterium RIFCSPHIGHO2_12_FULL_35_23]|nr:MAG: ABC transporter ATP-binding protein [Gammaproteobacteria bacterium RIFCSPHIGHO2_12_FULL_35_23]
MIKINKLEFSYPHTKLFSDLSLNLEKGCIAGLLGKNGSGKTTLLKIIAGLVFPQAGSCQIMEQIPKKRLPSFLVDIYYLAEDLYVPALTAKEYIKFYTPFYPKFDLSLFNTYLNEFALPEDKLLPTLSHGQKKKFLIAFGLATQCKLLILDEPTNGLDIPSKAQFRKLLAGAINEERLFIISTHQVHDVENIIDYTIILEEGKIIFQQSLLTIAKYLAFKISPMPPDPANCFYYEKHLNGYTSVMINQDHQETEIDLEILFNAVLANRNKLQQLFNEVQS